MCFTLQFIHMVIMLWINFCIFYMVYAAIFNKKTKLFKAAYITIAIEVTVLLMFGFECPLTLFQWYLYPGSFPVAFIPEVLVKNSTLFGFCMMGLFFVIKIYKLIRNTNGNIKRKRIA
jgi:hypothetical protein